MGGIRTTGISVECDRCHKPQEVTKDDEADFYRKFAEREDRNEFMFQALFLGADGSSLPATFEYLCPKCCNAVETYMKKILMVKEEKAAKPEKKEKAAKPAAEAKAEPANGGGGEEKKSIVVKDETESETPPEDTGADFDDNELFT